MIDVTKAIELSKKIRTLEEAKSLCEWIGDYANKGLLNFIENQQKEIESLKCCGNCRHDVNTVTGTGRCFNCSFVKDKPFDLYEDHWEIKDTKS